MYLPEQWAEMEQRLKSAEPVYIYVAANKQEQLEQRGNRILMFLDQRYQIVRRSSNGTWYEFSGVPIESVTAAQTVTASH